MTPTALLEELLSQHRALREMMDRCDALANEIDRGMDPSPLTHEVAKLRAAFGAHNEFEERLLRPMLYAHDAFATARIDRLVDDHIAEHRAMRAQLRDDTPTATLRDLIDMLRIHLDAEERYLLTPQVLRGAAGFPAIT